MAWQVGHPIKRDGTSQRQRYPDILRPEAVRVDDRKEEDLWLYLYQLSDQFVFYNAENLPDGDWTCFFEPLKQGRGQVTRESVRAFINEANKRNDNSVFLSLINAFLKMFRYLQADINTLTKKHLDFYFETVLGFRRQAAKPDEVHVIFELASQVKHLLVSAGTALNAGKDASGNLRTYLTKNDLVVNQAQVAALKTLLVNSEGIYAAEVANSADGLGAPLDSELPHWPAFGHPDYMQRSTVGFAIASPLLLLKEGERTIILTLQFTSDPSGISAHQWRGLQITASGEKEWINLSVFSAVRNGTTVVLTITLQPELPAIVPYMEKTLQAGINSSFPVLRLMLNPNRPEYEIFSALVLQNYRVQVVVAADTHHPGVRDLVIQNDQGLLDANQTFLPFGPTPEVGANFYIGSEEVFSKSITSINIILKWSGLPDETLSDYYSEYYPPRPIPAFHDITASIALLNNGQWRPINNVTILESDVMPSAQSGSINISGNLNLKAVSTLQLHEGVKANIKQGFLKLTLLNNFRHKDYLTTFAFVSKAPGNNDFPNPPYTPALESISLGYTASEAVVLKTPSPFFQFFYIEPFGITKQSKIGERNLFPTLPEAALHIGIKDLDPPQNLHLLFQVSESAPEAKEVIRNNKVTWGYLTQSGWEKFVGGEIFSDTTLALQQSGIIQFSIPLTASLATDWMPQGIHWLRATLSEIEPSAAAMMIDIHTQAVRAVFQDADNDPEHLVHPLPSENIKSLTKRLAPIKKVSQPYASFGGFPSEKGEAFYTRVSERLRHKQRAITLWDMERLVLQEFKDIYKVKAIPHTGLDQEGYYSEFRPGQMTLVIIPQLRNRNNVKTLEPKASVAVMEGVRDYLLPYSSYIIKKAGFKALHVIPPRYEQVLLTFSVGFYQGFDSGFYREVLNEDLRRHLSPWAFKEGEDIAFGGKIYKSQLLAYVEELEYVDFVTDFQMFHLNKGPGIEEISVEIDLWVRGNYPGEDVEIAEASTATSILVSASTHIINVLQPDEYPCIMPEGICREGIGCWYIEVDLTVT